ncbi:hypothetical protein CQA49_03745 [Helicobacter sp. MIT 00-7814]|nr:hypothetical protein CQA49_03745 [Helicobacter sp. MIT 00-7814]
MRAHYNAFLKKIKYGIKNLLANFYLESKCSVRHAPSKKRCRGWGIDKGEGSELANSSPLPLIEQIHFKNLSKIERS